MNMPGVSLLSSLMPSAADPAARAPVSDDIAAAFAAMLSGLGQPAAPSVASASKSDAAGESVQGEEKGADPDQGERDDKGQKDDLALATPIAMPVPIVLLSPAEVEAAPIETGGAAAQPARMLLPQAAGGSRASAAHLEPPLPINPNGHAGLVPASTGEQSRGPTSSLSRWTPEQARGDESSSASEEQPAAMRLAPGGGRAPQPLPVETHGTTIPIQADGKAQAASAASAPATPTSVILAAREAVRPAEAAPAVAMAVAKPQEERKTASEQADKPDKTDRTDAPAPASRAPVVTPQTAVTTHDKGSAPAPQPPAPQAGAALAAGAADRQLDLARTNAWLDGIAHDIARTGDGSAPLRFEVSPERLGAVKVELRPAAEGATVTLTAASDAARGLLADAKHQLIADARAQGVQIAAAHVSAVSSAGNAGMGAADHHHADPNAQPAQDGGRSDAGASFTPSGGGFGQAGGGGDAGRHAQARQQPQPQTFARAPRPAPSAPVSAAAHPARRSTDARYA